MRNPSPHTAVHTARTLTFACLAGLLAFAAYLGAPQLHNVLAEGLTPAFGSNFTRVVRTAGENGSSGAASKPTGNAARQFSSSALTGKIAFASTRDGGNTDIYVMNSDGTGQTRLTSNPALDTEPAFDPGGNRIAFTSLRDGNANVYVMDADGTGQTQLTTTGASDSNSAFSPNGNRIAFTSNRDGNTEIYVMSTDGTNQTRLTNNPAADFDPAFSPDGAKIVFTSTRAGAGNRQIYMMNADGTGQTRLTNNPEPDFDPAFSPDGNKIVFTSVLTTFNFADIFVMNADGTGRTQLTSTGTISDTAPAFSPDGSMIVFDSGRDGNKEIYVMNIDGTNQTRLTNNPSADTLPSWASGSVVSLAVNDVSLAEGNSGTNLFTFTVTKSGTASRNVTVRVDTADDTATAPGDYAPIVNQTLTFLPNDTMKTVTVSVIGDTRGEPDETFFVNLTNATDALIGDRQGEGFIVNDDFGTPIHTLPNLLEVVIFEQTNLPNPHVIRNAPNAQQLRERLPDPLTAGSRDFSQFDEEYYDFFYSDEDGTPNPDGTFLTIEGVWRDRSILCCARFGGMNINEVELRFLGVIDRGDFVSSFVRGSICDPNNPDTPEQCIPGSQARAVDNDLNTFPRLGHTSATNLNERFRLTIGFDGISGPPPPPQSTVQFSSETYNAAEGTPSVTITVTRTGDTTGEAFFSYETADGTAIERKDYTTVVGRRRFGPGESSTTFDILITDDAFNDDGESFNIILSNPTGAALGSQRTATIQITDNDSADGPSPVRETGFNPQFFSGQHYADFLGRAPDPPGLAFWADQTTNCGNPDTLVCRINVSAAFFLSIEYQETGFLAHRAHKAAFGNLPGKPVPIVLRDFLAGSRRIGDGVQVGVGNWQQQLEANKVAYFDEFVTGEQFTILYSGMSNGQYVDELNLNAGGALSQSERDALVSGLNAGTMTRARALRLVAEDSDLAQSERNRAFVLAQYFGYLRRDPDAAPDTNFDGYNFWLTKLNQFNGNFIEAEMVKAFILSIEYGDRFGQ